MSYINKIFLILTYVTWTFGNAPISERLLKKSGYPYQEHTVQTTDGYILLVYRIPPSKNSTKHKEKLPPVVMLHGLTSSSDDYLLNGRNSMPFAFSNEGYDVWLFNFRYTYGTTHKDRSRSDNSYWDFSYDEIGTYDIPNSIDYVLNVTNSDKVISIAVSISNVFYVIMLNQRPDMIDKIALNVVMAPAYFPVLLQSSGFLWRAFKLDDIYLKITGGKQYLAIDGNWETVKDLCSIRSELNLCYSVLFFYFGIDWEEISWDNGEVLFGRGFYFSLRMINHFMQIMGTGVLARYDNGYEGNIKNYGTPYPPAYSWKVLKPTTIVYWGMNDRGALLQDFRKALNLLKSSGCKLYVRTSKWKHLNHGDYLSGRTVASLLNKDLLKMIKRIL